MQTFLPVPSFIESARILDRQRLGKQRVEAWQILATLMGMRGERHPDARKLPPYSKHGWRKHPAVLMWKGHEAALCLYGIAMCEQWIARGYEDNLLERFKKPFGPQELLTAPMPSWLDDMDFHAAHRSNLLRKNFAHYSQFGWTEGVDLPYIWPAQQGDSK